MSRGFIVISLIAHARPMRITIYTQSVPTNNTIQSNTITQCSGHGLCDDGTGSSTFKCSCNEGWGGGDCSERVCPVGLTWFDYPTANNKAHFSYSTCSNMGICDLGTGVCVCRQGFYGESCEYMGCGGGLSSPCNGRGKCLAMRELALWRENNGEATTYVNMGYIG